MSLDDASKMQVRDVMTTKVITVKGEQTREQAARLLSGHRISGLPVVNDDDVLVGVVTEYDIIAKEGKTVDDIMTRGVISVSADADLEAAKHILVHERIKRLPVVDRGRVIGIVSRADIVKEIAMHWICYVCGEVVHSEQQPERCPCCGAVEVTASSEPLPPGS
jgi:predicted transcriptional regulator